MSEVGSIDTTSFQIGDLNIVFNHHTLIMIWVVIFVICLALYLLTRNMTKIPSRGQTIVEMLIDYFDKLAKESLGKNHRKYLPFIVTIFLFVLVSNWIGIVPLM